ncbi:helix-turn-helix domain-containing protein [Sciscionella marina]|uniref:helix-turn-helix domain-containing protein n=1 Tax=Sciscionella marina TaxID=508770 RepID=UPI003B83652B
MWVRSEPVHDVTYFTPESRARAHGLCCRGGWMGYVGMRAARSRPSPPRRSSRRSTPSIPR